jgi:monoamine oxidase
MISKIDTDVIIVGAGASGIFAATHLKKLGLKSIILEANDVIGGRLRSQEIAPNINIELGGQWLAEKGQKRLSAPIDQFGFKRLTNYKSGNFILVKDGIPLITDSFENKISFLAQLDILRFSAYLSWTLKTISVKRPWRQVELDLISLALWMENKLWTSESKLLFKNMFEQGLCCDLSEISALEGLSNLKTIGNLELLQNADHFYFKEGLQNLFYHLAKREELEIFFRQDVVSIKQDDHGVEVQTKERFFFSRAVLVTVPLPLLNKILFKPELPHQFQKLTASVVQGQIIKVIAVYNSPWWRKSGLNGIVSDSNGSFDLVIDSSPDSNSAVLVGLVSGPRAKSLQNFSNVKIQEIFNLHIETNFGVSEKPIDFYFFDWNNDEYSMGGYSSRREINQWNEARDCLQMPFERIFFAGTETALEWRGYIEGALESAERQSESISLWLGSKSI